MMIPPVSADEYLNDLYDQVRTHLVELFDHSPDEAYRVLADYYEKHPEQDEEFYIHQGSFTIALFSQYDIVLGKNPSDPAFAAWRKACVSAWSAKAG